MSVINILDSLSQLLGGNRSFQRIEAEKESGGQFPLKPGQAVTVDVLSILPDSRVLVRVAGELLRMELPIPAQPGDAVPMTFVSADPRPTFAMSRSEGNAPPVSISNTAKFLGNLASTPLPAPGSSSVAPLLDCPTMDKILLAQRLRESLTLSGVFYESHLVQWAQGERSLKEILKEPQGKLAIRKFPPGAVKDPSIPAAAILNEEDSSEGKASGAAVAEKEEVVAHEALPLVQRQVHTLHSGEFVWQGQAWPGQDMEWRVRERGARRGEEGKEEREWETCIFLDLPKLGGVEASLSLTQQGVQLHIITNRETAALMETERASLSDAMKKAGLHLEEVIIDNGQDQPR